MALIYEVFRKFNIPKALIYVSGAKFNNCILSEINKHFDIKKTNITVYHAASNGLVGRQLSHYQ